MRQRGEARASPPPRRRPRATHALHAPHAAAEYGRAAARIGKVPPPPNERRGEGMPGLQPWWTRRPLRTPETVLERVQPPSTEPQPPSREPRPFISSSPPCISIPRHTSAPIAEISRFHSLALRILSTCNKPRISTCTPTRGPPLSLAVALPSPPTDGSSPSHTWPRIPPHPPTPVSNTLPITRTHRILHAL